MPKDYSYRSSWEHKFSRALNKERRGGLSKEEMFKKYGRFPTKQEFWSPSGMSEKEWTEQWIKDNPKY